MSPIIVPDWPAPARVRAASTIRTGGASKAPYDTFNLGAHVGDEPASVEENRRRLRAELQLAVEPFWLQQVHGTHVVRATERGTPPPQADAAYAIEPGPVCVVMAADCLPVLFCTRDGSRVAAAHAGWRGLAAGVLEETVHALGVPGQELLAWLGPAIEPEHFEVGAEVRETFLRGPTGEGGAAQAFVPLGQDKWLADLYALARLRLRKLGIESIGGATRGTYRERASFFSHRRDGRCGRMATLIWIS